MFQRRRNRRIQAVRRHVSEALLFLNMFGLITTIVLLMGETTLLVKDDADPDNTYINLVLEYEDVVITLESLSVAFSGLFAMVFGLWGWWSVYRAAQCILLLTEILKFVVSTLTLVINYDSARSSDARDYSQARYFPHVATILCASAFVGVVVCIAIGDTNRFNEVMTRLISSYIVLSAIAIAMSIGYIGVAASIYVRSSEDASSIAVLTANPVLATVAVVLCLVGIVCAVQLQAKPRTFLSVEVLDLNSLTEAETAAYAAAIDQHGRGFPGAPSGANAMSLMKAYAATKIDGMHCQVLRVFDPNKQLSGMQKSALTASTAAMNNNTANTTGRKSRANEQVAASYESYGPWANLDKEVVLPLDVDVAKKDVPTSAVTDAAKATEAPKLSKNELKRLKKKQAKGKNVTIPPQAEAQDQPIISPEFVAKLHATEALVMHTVIESYDLTSNVGGHFGRFLAKTVGAESWFRLSCVRLGLLAFHWPFRQGTFYCSSARRPVARSAAVLRGISSWNKSLKGSERCAVLLDPRYEFDATERSIQPSGWVPTPLPPSHIVDLRPFKGKDINEYLKAVKYRNQATAFARAGGEVIETTTFKHEEVSEILDLWARIAERRTAEGYTAVLARPQHDLLQSLGTVANDKGFRTLMFLKVEGKVIASSVVFRLGDTITSDLQGLDHDLSRQYKAYFVMMQATIETALREGLSFVDFGPTTSKPKEDIGAKSVPIMAGMKASNGFMTSMIRLFAKKVNSG